ncbi:8357_t:CDS:2, partial [Diversispora eburnea]
VGNNNSNLAIQSTKDPTNGKFNDVNIIKFKPMPWVEKNTILMVEAGMQRLRFDLLGSHSADDNNIIINSKINNNFNNNFNDNNFNNFNDNNNFNNFNNNVNNDNYSFSNNVEKNVVVEKKNSSIVYPNSQPHTINFINNDDDAPFAETSEITEITTEIEIETTTTEKLFYITCVFLTERRATVFPREGSFIQFIEYIQKRFGLPQLQQCHNLSYKNKVNDIISLKDEEDWNVAKWEIEMEGTIRLDVFVE